MLDLAHVLAQDGVTLWIQLLRSRAMRYSIPNRREDSREICRVYRLHLKAGSPKDDT